MLKNNYKIKFSSDVLKNDLPKINTRTKEIIIRKIEKLEDNPNIGIPLKGKLHNYFKIRISKYRVVYEVFRSELIIHIVAIGKRDNSEVYHMALKRIN